ncbi:MAG: hypothetical protein ACYDC2_11075 [Solirubrobacteraceae bacterium]
MSDGVQTGTVKTNIPARLDRLPFSRFHWVIILGLGTAWILDGLEVTWSARSPGASSNTAPGPV